MSTPMPPAHLSAYLRAVSASTAAYVRSFDPRAPPSAARLTLLVPELDPSLDVFHRRALLRFVWAVLDVLASRAALRTRVLVQGSGPFGGLPLAVAGLRAQFDADLHASRDAWGGRLRAGNLEDEADLDDRDQVVVVVAPTNAVSVPVVDALRDVVQRRARGRPVILINPRLDDVPSHSGVMQVAGRAERLRFLHDMHDIFYLKLLFSSGTVYPLRGILFRAYPGPWEVWRSEAGDTDYRRILAADTRPTTADITSAFTRDRYEERKRRREGEMKDGVQSFEELVVSPAGLTMLGLAAVGAALYLFGTDGQRLAAVLPWL